MRFDSQILSAFAVSASLALSGGAAQAATLPFAGGYGAFVFGSYSGTNSDVELNLAAGGAVQLTNYSVGQHTNPASAASLDVGGSAQLTNGEVGPGGAGSITAGGAVAGSGFTAATVDQNTAPAIDFAAAQMALTGLSTTLAALTPTGDVLSQWSSLTLTGTQMVNVFFITQAQWESNNTVNINTPDGATNILNIAGTNLNFAASGGQIFFNGVAGGIDGAANASTLYNVFEATTLTVGGGKGAQGSILAPLAAVTGNYGQINGQLIAASFSGHTQINRPGYNGWLPEDAPDIAPVPLPAGIWLGLAAMGALGLAGRRRRA
jgi:choice-of-anchor A domain-containing protein